jgi:hypothetical protein
MAVKIKTLREGKIDQIDFRYISFEQGVELAVKKTCNLLKKLNSYLLNEDEKRLPTIDDLQYLHKKIQILKKITGKEKLCNRLLEYNEKAAEQLSACYTEKKDPSLLRAYIAAINEGLLKIGAGEDFKDWEADNVIMEAHKKAKAVKIRKNIVEKKKEEIPLYIL